MGGGSTTPFRWGATPLTERRAGMGLADASVGGGVDLEWGGLLSPIIWRGYTLQISLGTVVGRRNISPATRGSRGRGEGRGRGRRGGVLPNWCLRVPLQDITGIAIGRRRARMREGEGLQLESSIPQEQAVFYPIVSTSGAQLEHCTSTSGRPRPISVPKILFDITNQKDGESDGVTPQKKLLNSLDKVEKVVIEELRKMKRTPAAKRAERDKKVKTLMSMR